MCFENVETYGLISCGHVFCFLCISNWSKNANCCPLCKSKFNFIRKIDESNKEFVAVEAKLDQS